MTQATRTYLRNFGLAMAAYVVILLGVVTVLPATAGSVWRFPLVLLPIVPIGFGLRAFLNYLEQMDELQQRVQLAGIAFAAGATGMVSFVYGFLELAGLPRISWIWIFPMLIILWGIGVGVASRRYR